MNEPKRPLKVFLCHAHADRDPVPQGDDMRGLYSRLIKDGVDAWLDKAKLISGQGFDRLNLPDWELEIIGY
ncbi:MAG: toll/interleukin-1 receptor domain-containing protein [Anaerolineales bacterium]|nr:toll/interleukin-1 receptor domain-containing protein [Anaerolineales bacterium]